MMEQREIKVSVVMPVYNAAKYLEMALSSLVKQTLKEIEIICVDDGSTDNSWEILEHFAEQDSRFTLLRQNNMYAGVARNNGMKIATGKYLSFLDADDYFKSEMLEKAYESAETYNADITVFGAEHFKDTVKNAYHSLQMQEKLLPEGEFFAKKELQEVLFTFTTTSPWNKIFKHDFVRKQNLQFQPCKRVNDAYFVDMALALADKISVVREDLICYRIGNSSSLQGTKNESPLQFVTVFYEIQQELEARGLYAKLGKSFRNAFLNSCIYNLGTLTQAAAFEELYRKLQEDIFQKFHIAGTDAADYYNKQAYGQYEYIMQNSAVEYWMDKYKRLKAVTGEYDYLFPYEQIKEGSRIILYAAGKVGKQFYAQIQKNRYCNIVMWVDKNYENYNGYEVEIGAPDKIAQVMFDKIVIAIEDMEVKKSVFAYLQSLGVEKEKIVL